MEEYARRLFPGKKVILYPATEVGANAPEQTEVLLVNVWEDFVAFFKDKSEDEMLIEAERIWNALEKKAEVVVMIMTECGCGIVPLGAAERRQRERCGILLSRLAAKSDRVDRVMAGLGICFKGEKGEIS